jgi:hypothetical protein
MISKTGAAKVLTLEAEEKALTLRRIGVSYRDIARAMTVSLGQAHKLVKRGLARRMDKCEELAEEVRTLELERLDLLMRGIWKNAESGNTQAIDRVLKIMERRSSLLGLDAPKRHAIAGDDDRPPIKHAHELSDEALAHIAAGGRP